MFEHIKIYMFKFQEIEGNVNCGILRSHSFAWIFELKIVRF